MELSVVLPCLNEADTLGSCIGKAGEADLVQGCRLPSGGGRVLPGAMPFLHREVWVRP